MPNGATLWAARVAGTPVKPLQGTDTIRIPIVKTAEGDQDYAVELVYGGRLRNLESYRRIEFPFVQPLHIVPETSQVRLYLPQSHQWLRFDGPMRNVRHENELTMELLEYQSQQIGSAIMDMKSSDRYVRGRAERTLAYNLKQLAQNELDTDQLTTQAQSQSESVQLQSQLARARELLEDVPAGKDEMFQGRVSNRKRLNDAYLQQSNGAISNSITAAKGNFVESGRELSDEVAQAATPSNPASPADSEVPNNKLRLQLKKSRPNQAPQELAKNDLGSARSNSEDHLYEQRSSARSQRQGGMGGMGGGWWSWGGASASGPAAQEVLAPPSDATPQSGAESDSDDPFDDFDEIRPDNTVMELGEFKADEIPSGIASLDVQLEFSGQEFQFTTPRGDVRLSAVCLTPQSRQFAKLFLGLVMTVVVAAFCARREW
ncbi:MAG: hypothetical protein O3C60_16895 [Planctomycetota bacterium]|nr:hypothetical protein [Planctomycetota bacterium]